MKDSLIQVKSWMTEFVIGLNLCPFANREFINDRIRYEILTPQEKVEDIIYEVWAQISALKADKETSTTLIIFERNLNDFEIFLDVVEIINALIKDRKLDEDFQLAHFHPDYRFENTELDAPENYTNRSPLPIIQILRVDQLADAINQYGNTASIPLDNIKKMNDLGIEEIKKRMESIA